MKQDPPRHLHTDAPPPSQGDPHRFPTPYQAPQSSKFSPEELIPARPDKNPAIASLLSFVAPGLGHLYLGQTTKGLVILFGGGLALLWACGLAAPLVGLDAYTMAVRLQEGKPVRTWQWFWDED
jgi:hypothetical protein